MTGPGLICLGLAHETAGRDLDQDDGVEVLGAMVLPSVDQSTAR